MKHVGHIVTVGLERVNLNKLEMTCAYKKNYIKSVLDCQKTVIMQLRHSLRSLKRRKMN
jgi:hypothetical protein